MAVVLLRVPTTDRTAPSAESPRVTLPEVTAKSEESNLAIPLFESLASSPEIVTVFAVRATSIPSPALMLTAVPNSIDLSAPEPFVAKVMLLFSMCTFRIVPSVMVLFAWSLPLDDSMTVPLWAILPVILSSFNQALFHLKLEVPKLKLLFAMRLLAILAFTSTVSALLLPRMTLALNLDLAATLSVSAKFGSPISTSPLNVALPSTLTVSLNIAALLAVKALVVTVLRVDIPSTVKFFSKTAEPSESIVATTVLAESVITSLESPAASANCKYKSESPRTASAAKNISTLSPAPPAKRK